MQDIYLNSSIKITRGVKIQAVLLILPLGGVVGGRTAAWLHGADVLRRDDPPEVVLPRGVGMGPRRDLRIKRALLTDHDIMRVGGIPVVTPIRAAFDLARRAGTTRAGLVEAVVAVDALAHLATMSRPPPGSFSLDELLVYAAAHGKGLRGVRSVPKVVDLADPLAESPPETRLRLVIVLAGLPRPICQVRVFERTGLLIAKIDMGYPEIKFGVEYDGQDHAGRWASDIRRQNNLFEAGWRLRRHTKDELYRSPRLIVQQVSEVLHVNPRRS